MIRLSNLKFCRFISIITIFLYFFFFYVLQHQSARTEKFLTMNLIFYSNCWSRLHAKHVINLTLIYQTNSQLNELKFTKMMTNHEKYVIEAKLMQSNQAEKTKLCILSPEKYDVIAFDLQQSLPNPHLQVGPASYLRKIWLYNCWILVFKPDQGYMYIWTEEKAKRGCEEIVSIVLKHIKSHQKPRFIFCSSIWFKKG